MGQAWVMGCHLYLVMFIYRVAKVDLYSFMKQFFILSYRYEYVFCLQNIVDFSIRSTTTDMEKRLQYAVIAFFLH